MRKKKKIEAFYPLGLEADNETDGRGLRSCRTREKIRRTAGKLFVENGIENTTVDRITQAAGISKGTFYLHFSCKDDLVLEYAERRLVHAERLLPELSKKYSTLEAIRRLFTILLKKRDWNQDLVKSILLQLEANYDQLHTHDLRQLLLPQINLGISRGEIRSDIPPGTLASFVTDAVYNALRNWGMERTSDDLDKELDYAIDLVFDAIRKR